MEDGEQDEQPGDAGPAEAAPTTSSTGISASQLYKMRREVAEARRVIESTEQPDLEHVIEAGEAAEEAGQALASVDLLAASRYAESIAKTFASLYDTSAFAQMALFTSVPEEIASPLRVWDEVVPRSALGDMVEQINKSISHVYDMPGFASSLAATAESVRSAESVVEVSGIASIAETVDAWWQSTAAASSILDAVDQSALSQVVEASSIYTKTLFDSIGAGSAMAQIASEAMSGAIGSLIDSPAYVGLRSTLYDDATFSGLHSFMEQTDLSGLASLAQRALGDVPLGALEEAAARLRSEDLDEEEFEDAAIQALRETDEDFDPDAPPTPEEVAATEAFVQLLMLLRPDLTDDPALRKRVRWVGRGGGALVGVYLLVFHLPVFAAVGTLLILLGFANGGGNVIDRISSPSAYKDDEETPTSS
ncbi:MAG: hypothetical protein KQH57_10075 [Actinomycetales bacterium]|nr:hypothetical protein [Actinomycetales bacterium]